MNTPLLLSWLHWNPSRDAFTLPFFNLSVAWYGILFATGFIAGYFILLPIITKHLLNNSKTTLNEAKAHSIELADQLTWYIVLGTIIGARLGHVLFYDLHTYIKDPLEIFMLRHGGLASHGGTLGVILALLLFLYKNKTKFPSINFVTLVDLLVIPTAITATFIRLGNFVNQEILGTPSHLPWAIVFESPADGSLPVPRHPVQLYEAVAYLITFVILYSLWKRYGNSLQKGTLSGLFFIFVFGSRFFLEFLKKHQGAIIDESFLQMGQILSLPFVLFGIFLLFYKQLKKEIDHDRNA